MQKISPDDNRFERLWRKCRKRLHPINYIVRITGIVVIMLILLEFFSFIIINFHTFLGKNMADSGIDMDVYKGKDWVEDYRKEFAESFKAEYSPYVIHKRVPNYNGKYINLDENSIRSTFFQCENKTSSIRIFVFGGSTIWGTEARDNSTIPSFLSKFLCHDGIAVEVTNFGESGYVNTQEMIKLMLELRKGNIPDIVVFYDGINDVYSSYQNKIAGAPQNLVNRQKEFNSRGNYDLQGTFSNFNRILAKIARMLYYKNTTIQPIDDNLSQATKDLYFGNVKIIKSLENEFGFKSFFYWQPIIYTKKYLSYDEKNKIIKDRALEESYIKVLKEIKVSKEIIDLTNIFDDKNKTIFIDGYHISEEGNSIIAEKIAKDILIYLNKS